MDTSLTTMPLLGSQNLTSYSSTGMLPSTQTSSTPKTVAVVTSQPAKDTIAKQQAATQDLVNTTNTYAPLKSFLASQGQAFSQDNLSKLASQYGIQNYNYTDEQNKQLASLIQSQQPKNQTQTQTQSQTGSQTTPQTSVSVTSYRDNPDGTSTVTYSDGTTDTGNYVKNVDGTYAFKSLTTTNGKTAELTPYQQQYMKQMDDAYSSYQDTVKQIFDGTFLTPDQQAQISAVQATFDRMKNLQTVANQNYEKLAEQASYIQGQNVVDPQQFIAKNQQVIQNGLDKIASIDTAAQKALAELKQSFLDKNYKMANDTYTTLSNYLKEKNALIQKSVDDAKAAEKDLRDYNFQVQQHVDQMNQHQSDRIADIQKTAAQNGAPLSVLAQIGGAKSEVEAIAAAGNYMQNELENQYKKAQIDKIYADIKNAGVANTDPSLALAYAQQYASTGQIPTGLPKGTFGIVAQVAKELPKQPGEVVSTATGVKPQGNNTYVDSLSNYYSMIQLAKEMKNIGEQLKTAKPGADSSRLIQDYNGYKDQVTDLLTRVRTGAALNKDEQARYSSQLPSWQRLTAGIGSPDAKIDVFINSLSKDITQKAASQGYAIYGLSTVKLQDGKNYTVGDILTGANGSMGRVNPDGSITVLNQ